MLLELVKGGYRGAKKGRIGRVGCKGWNLTIDFLVVCTKTGGYEKSEDGEFPATGGPPYILLTPESCDSYRKTIL